MTFGVSDTPTGFAVCAMAEHDIPLMLATKPLEYKFQAIRAQRILEAESHSPLAGQVAAALRRAAIFEPMVTL